MMKYSNLNQQPIQDLSGSGRFNDDLYYRVGPGLSRTKMGRTLPGL